MKFNLFLFRIFYNVVYFSCEKNIKRLKHIILYAFYL